MENQVVYYFVGPVRTGFDHWLGCGTKLCKDRKKDKMFCHIRPDTVVHPIGNGLYECAGCHDARLKKVKEDAAQAVAHIVNMQREEELERWWQAEMAKPRKPHPAYYTEHNPLAKSCPCEFCTVILPSRSRSKSQNNRPGRNNYNH